MATAIRADRKLGAILAKKTHRGGRFTVVELADGGWRIMPTLSHHLRTSQKRGALPPSTNWASKCAASTAQPDGNTQQGDCVIASIMHRIGGWTGNESGTPAVGNDDESLQTYAEVCGPGDQGCVITDVLDAAKTRGIPVGGKVFKITDYAALDWTNQTEIQTCLVDFGPSCHIGFNLPARWYDNAPSSGFIWDALSPADANDIVGGHDVCFLDYDAQGVVIATWGMTGRITWKGLGQPGIVTEAYCNLSPDWTAVGGVTPNGIDTVTLAADLALLAQGQIPPLPGPVTPPTPGTGLLTIDPVCRRLSRCRPAGHAR